MIASSSNSIALCVWVLGTISFLIRIAIIFRVPLFYDCLNEIKSFSVWQMSAGTFRGVFQGILFWAASTKLSTSDLDFSIELKISGFSKEGIGVEWCAGRSKFANLLKSLRLRFNFVSSFSKILCAFIIFHDASSKRLLGGYVTVLCNATTSIILDGRCILSEFWHKSPPAL